MQNIFVILSVAKNPRLKDDFNSFWILRLLSQAQNDKVCRHCEILRSKIVAIYHAPKVFLWIASHFANAHNDDFCEFPQIFKINFENKF